jgi:hypothetical protein
MDALLIHGYSETSLGVYFDMPDRIKAALAHVDRIVLAAFNSLDDTVTIDDLAVAMEHRVRSLENTKQFTTSGSAVICHSTGALIARRWILNRLSSGGAIPSHLITMAGANHGSTLAQMGKSVLGYFQKLLSKHLPTVGASVLTDLDYGSDFLLRLNREWMDCWNNGSLAGLYAFSLGGDSVGGDPALQVFWQTHEPGSDNTVRISGANLNYTLITAKHSPAGPVVTAKRPIRPVPHRVLAGYSHFGAETGILGWVQPPPVGDLALASITEALSVTDATSYRAVADRWSQHLDDWMTAQRKKESNTSRTQINATAVFSIRDASGRPIDDCVIAILDQRQLNIPATAIDATNMNAFTTAANDVSSAILPHSPIQNDVQRSSYSFYMDYDAYVSTSPHWFHVDASVPTQLVAFVPLLFTQPAELAHTVAPNEFTYVSLTMSRYADDAYAMYGFSPQLNLAGTAWMPFPKGGRLS